MFQTVSLLGLELTIDGRLRWANDLLAGLSAVIAVSRAGSSPLSGSLRIEHGNVRHARHSADPLEPGIRRTNEGLLDEEYGVLVNFPSSTEIVLRTEYSCPEWFSWSLQLQALRNRAAFVHSAGLERNGKAVLLAERNGFGKTALLGDFMRRAGWRLLGNDLTLLSADGTCYGCPRALAYPDHRPFLSGLFARCAEPSVPRALSSTLERAGRMVTPLLRQVPGLLESTRRDSQQTVAFARERSAAFAPLATVVRLKRRNGISRAELWPLHGSLATQLLVGTVEQFDRRCVRISNVAMALGLLDLETTYGVWIDVLRAGLVRARSYTLCAPTTLPLEEIPAVVHNLLSAAGIGAPAQESSCA